MWCTSGCCELETMKMNIQNDINCIYYASILIQTFFIITTPVVKHPEAPCAAEDGSKLLRALGRSTLAPRPRPDHASNRTRSRTPVCGRTRFRGGCRAQPRERTGGEEACRSRASSSINPSPSQRRSGSRQLASSRRNALPHLYRHVSEKRGFLLSGSRPMPQERVGIFPSPVRSHGLSRAPLHFLPEPEPCPMATERERKGARERSQGRASGHV